MTGALATSAVRAHLRLTLLRLLANRDEAGGGGSYPVNESVLADALNRFGFLVGRDNVRTDLAWLAEQDMVRLQTVAGLTAATMTDRGLELAARSGREAS